jgi:copper chaperone CopZ
MKKIILSCLFLLSLIMGKGQFTSATLQASGLTCALCAKSIFTNLTALSFVGNVDTDLNSSTFLISFKPGNEVYPDQLKKKVEAAGFSVSNLVLTFNANGETASQLSPLKIGSTYFHFIQAKAKELSGEVQMQIIEKGYIGIKEYKKLLAGNKLNCYQTTEIADCQNPDLNNAFQSVHVLLK